MMDWNEYFFRSVYLAAHKSKDPSSGVGSILVNYDHKSIISTGYNGFARKIIDSDERLNDRTSKYSLTIHSELNSVIDAARKGISTVGSHLYVCGTCCENCCKAVLQAGVSKIIIHEQYDNLWNENSTRPGQDSWKNKSKWTEIMCEEAGVPIEKYNKFLNIEVLIGGKKYLV